MKRSLFYTLFVLLLSGLAIWLYLREHKSTVNQQLTNFAVEDTASVTKIFMANKEGKAVTLDRMDGYWTVNQAEKARQDMINNLLYTIKAMKVRTPVTKSMHNNVVRQLAGNSVKVEIYQNNTDEPMKVYFVGGPNKDHTGSYMLLEGSSVPYVMHIEGHYGYLSSRYSVNRFIWRDNWIWQFPGKEITKIQEINITNHRKPKQSFSVKKEDDVNYQVFDASGNLINAEKDKVLQYVKQFDAVAFEGYEETKLQSYLDSVTKAIPPMHTVSLTTTGGETTEVTTWPKPIKKGSVTLLSGDTIDYDMERMYMIINDEKLVIGQYFTFGPLTVDASFFEN